METMQTETYVSVVLGLAVVFLSILVYLGNWKPRNFPPGPFSFPVVGNLLQLGPEPHKKLMRLSEKYGEIFSIKLGGFQTVVINGKENIDEALVTMKNIFAGRPPFAINDFLPDSVAFKDFDEEWSWKKKQIVRGLGSMFSDKNFGFNEILQEATEGLIEDFAKQKGVPFNPFYCQYLSSLCTAYMFLFDKREDIRKSDGIYDFKRITDSQKDFILFAYPGNIYNVLPWLKSCCPWGYRKLLSHNDDFERLSVHKVLDLNDTYVPNHVRGTADCFLSVNADSEDRNKLLFTLPELLAAAFDSSATTLLWTYMFMVKNQDIQEKVQDAIDQEVGQARVTLEDRKKLPIIDAVILEAMRLEPPIPLGLPKWTLDDCEFKGYLIPKGTVVLTNYFSVNWDPNLWTRRDKFIPERFLKADGTLDHVKENIISPFGIGQRKCPGEVVARAQLFVSLANILQRFKLRMAEGQNYEVTGVPGLTSSPSPFQIIAEER